MTDRAFPLLRNNREPAELAAFPFDFDFDLGRSRSSSAMITVWGEGI
ncbi:hypothetical protein ACWD6R_37110 [Streptomyces sp. NPDC005151]